MEQSYKSFVSVGNCKQNFNRLLNAVNDNLLMLPKPILIQYGHNTFTSSDCDVIDFINMDKFSYLISNANIVILHAGAGSILQAIQYNKFPIVMPRMNIYGEHINDHQIEFAKTLHIHNKVAMITNSDELRDAIDYVLNNKLNYKTITGKTNFKKIESILDKELV